MYWARGAGVVAALAVVALNWQHALSNADFIYMCCAARYLADGGVPVTPYFPAGYPVLLGLLTLTGLTALKSGVLLSAAGTCLSISAVVWTALRLKLPVYLSLALGLLALTLPDVFEIAFNPHLDALYTGLGLWILALALAVLAGDDRPALDWWLVALSLLLISLRYHAVIIVLPVALVLVFRMTKAHRAGATLLIITQIAVGFCFAWLNFTTGSFNTAAADQVRTGHVYLANYDAVDLIFTDYAEFLETAPPVSSRMVAENVARVWPQYLLRRALWLGLAFWLVAILVGRYPPRSHWLVLFMLGYTLAVAPTYFTPRASALPELAALLLLAQSLAALLAPRRDMPARSLRTAGVLFTLMLVCGSGYNLWREVPVVRHWWRLNADVVAANEEALATAGGERLHLFGPMDYTAWPVSGRYNLPGAAYSRFWLDDPRVAHLVDPYIPRVAADDLVPGNAPVSVILLWERHGGRPAHPAELELIERLEHSWVWREQISVVPGTRLWIRGG
ncbi:hypothetical protein JW859_15320 [bacterium]|nr:hypothetical protein [bacterium]